VDSGAGARAGLTVGEVALRDVIPTDLPVLFAQHRDPEAAALAAFPPRDWAEFTQHWAKSFVASGERLVGYWIGREHWGRGVATAALRLFLAQLPARPLHAHVAKHNLASMRVLEKCGFRAVGEAISSLRGIEVAEVVFALA
jgi:RimJ/RimL family protein N-acetyltransferase